MIVINNNITVDDDNYNNTCICIHTCIYIYIYYLYIYILYGQAPPMIPVTMGERESARERRRDREWETTGVMHTILIGI
jgi:hypothetical protein